jgi:hypothetical protein
VAKVWHFEKKDKKLKMYRINLDIPNLLEISDYDKGRYFSLHNSRELFFKA